MNHKLVLATESQYKKNILKRLQIDFLSDAPKIDETPLQGESARALTERLARTKATLVALRHLDKIVISTDQSASVFGEILEKPKEETKALNMLKTLSGQQVSFFTTVGFSAPGQSVKLHTEEVIVTFRQLEEAEILRYVARDQPLDCAGSFKVESLGIGLFDAVESRDPTALEGLPLIKLCQWLRDHGFRIP
jgi:septum formation protein